MPHQAVSIGSPGVPKWMTFFSGFIVADDKGAALAVTGNDVVAQRIAVLLDRHGLADIPDDASEVAG